MALLQARILGLSQNHGIIKWSSGAVDASFPPDKGGGAKVNHSDKGKGILIHFTGGP